MFKRVFGPLVGLADKLGFRAKFAVIACLSLSATLFFLFQIAASTRSAIADSEKEQLGLMYAKPVGIALNQVEILRDLAVIVLAGDPSLVPQRDAAAQQLGKSINDLVALDTQHNHALALEKPLKVLTAHLAAIQALKTSSPDLETELTALETDLLLFFERVQDESGIALDPEAGPYYLTQATFNFLPAAQSQLSLLRSQGGAVLAAKSLSPDQTAQIVRGLGGAESEIHRALRFVAKASANIPAVAALHKTAETSLLEKFERLNLGTQSGMLVGQFFTPPVDFFTQVTEMISEMQVLNSRLTQLAEKAIDARIASQKQRLMRSTLLTLVASLTVMLALWVIYRSMNGTIRSLTSNIRKLAEGDLQVTFRTASQDELGQIAKDLNDTVAAWRELVKLQRHHGRQLGHEMQNLATRAQNIFLAAESELIAVEHVAVGIEAFSQSFYEVAASAESARTASATSSQFAQQSAGQIQHALDRIQHVALTVRESATLVEALSESSSQINQMVGSIGGIAKQTNLLALNAAIEAARAGEAGRGFTVVADEVRKLADHTTAATESIRNLLGHISDQVHTIANKMREGVIDVEDSVKLAQAVKASAEQMDIEAQHVVSKMAEIADAYQVQKSATTEINHEVTQVASLATQTAKHGNEVRSTLDDVRLIENALSEQLARFKYDGMEEEAAAFAREQTDNKPSAGHDLGDDDVLLF